jgi:hypothetical protein
MSDVKTCPIMTAGTGKGIFCGTNCGWWDDDQKQCAIVSITKAFTFPEIHVSRRPVKPE